MKCPTCGQSLPDDSLFCQYCGAKLPPQEPPASKPYTPNQVVLGFVRGSQQAPTAATPYAPPAAPAPPPPPAPPEPATSYKEPWERPDLPPSSTGPTEKELPQSDCSKNRKGGAPRRLVICLSLLLILSVICACVFRYQAYTMEGRIQELDFFEDHIGFIVDDDTEHYHNYYCYSVKTAETYEAHNVKYCQWLKYSPCRFCW